LAAEIVAAGPGAEVAMEATWGWYWAADVIGECGARLHLAHPLGIAGYENRRVKNDIRDATLLADLSAPWRDRVSFSAHVAQAGGSDFSSPPRTIVPIGDEPSSGVEKLTARP
jgi:hypothetical protein